VRVDFGAGEFWKSVANELAGDAEDFVIALANLFVVKVRGSEWFMKCIQQSVVKWEAKEKIEKNGREWKGGSDRVKEEIHSGGE
jgi:hypothetical protein